jgi:alkylation response protein AidB-like acyl-CoA dehydrogenase
VFEAIEELSIADGSIGWCLMNANGICLTAGWLDPDVAQHLFGSTPDIRVAGSLRPLGRACPVDNGYTISGTWNFASGLHNANWLYCPCVIMDGDRPSTTPAGMPVARSMWVHRPEVSIDVLDRWFVMGLRATGSDDFTISNLFVPEVHSVSILEEPRSLGPLYRPRIFLALFHLLFAANALGMVRGALNQLVEMAHREASSSSATILRDRSLVQGRIGQAEAIVRAARSYVVASLEQCWTTVCTSGDHLPEELAQLRLAIAHAINESVRAVDLLFAAAGTNSIYTANPIERRFRDLHVAVQHYAAFPVHYESAGKVLMGLTPSEPGW